MSDRDDFVVRSPDDKIQLVVEAKTNLEASGDWAAQVRKNLLRYQMVPASPYFILALPDHFYVWKHADRVGTAQPDLTIDARDVLSPYLKALTSRLEDLSGESFGLVVRTWLEDLVKAEPAAQSALPQQLQESELPARVKDGRVTGS